MLSVSAPGVQRSLWGSDLLCKPNGAPAPMHFFELPTECPLFEELDAVLHTFGVRWLAGIATHKEADTCMCACIHLVQLLAITYKCTTHHSHTYTLKHTHTHTQKRTQFCFCPAVLCTELTGGLIRSFSRSLPLSAIATRRRTVHTRKVCIPGSTGLSPWLSRLENQSVPAFEQKSCHVRLISATISAGNRTSSRRVSALTGLGFRAQTTPSGALQVYDLCLCASPCCNPYAIYNTQALTKNTTPSTFPAKGQQPRHRQESHPTSTMTTRNLGLSLYAPCPSSDRRPRHICPELRPHEQVSASAPAWAFLLRVLEAAAGWDIMSTAFWLLLVAGLCEGLEMLRYRFWGSSDPGPLIKLAGRSRLVSRWLDVEAVAALSSLPTQDSVAGARNGLGCAFRFCRPQPRLHIIIP